MSSEGPKPPAALPEQRIDEFNARKIILEMEDLAGRRSILQSMLQRFGGDFNKLATYFEKSPKEMLSYFKVSKKDERPLVETGKKAAGAPTLESRGPWGNEPFAWYEAHHKGLGRTELKEQNRPLYEDLKRRDELKKIPRKGLFQGDPLGYYETHYKGETRGKIQILNPALYVALRNHGLVDQLPLREYYGDDPLAYYREHFSHLSRGQLAKEQPGLYNFLYRRGLHTEVSRIAPVPAPEKAPATQALEHDEPEQQRDEDAVDTKGDE